MEDAIKKILEKRRDRVIATILGFKDAQCDDFLPADVSNGLRKLVLDQINDYFDLCCDLFKSVQPEGVILNQEYLDKLDEVHRLVTKDGG